MKIIKDSGSIVDYSPVKLKQSLMKSGASDREAQDILEIIEKEIYEGISTKQIYRKSYSLLKKISNSRAAKYNLKEGIRLLGPAGFFFERYIARLFSSAQYETKTNITLQGKCVSHELDVLAKKANIIAMIECKFHSGKDVKSDVKTPMYILSRFNDLQGIGYSIFSGKEFISKCWIVTNNRFTADAIKFAECSQLNLLSWDYPKNDNLKTKIEDKNLYPVTCLTTLSIAEKDKLLVLDVILAKELVNNSACLEKIGLNFNRIKNVLREASELCGYIQR